MLLISGEMPIYDNTRSSFFLLTSVQCSYMLKGEGRWEINDIQRDRVSKGKQGRMKTSISSKAFCNITDRLTDKIFTE